MGGGVEERTFLIFKNGQGGERIRKMNNAGQEPRICL